MCFNFNRGQFLDNFNDPPKILGMFFNFNDPPKFQIYLKFQYDSPTMLSWSARATPALRGGLQDHRDINTSKLQRLTTSLMISEPYRTRGGSWATPSGLWKNLYTCLGISSMCAYSLKGVSFLKKMYNFSWIFTFFYDQSRNYVSTGKNSFKNANQMSVWNFYFLAERKIQIFEKIRKC